MYNAYRTEEVVSKLPIEATSITNYADRDVLLIGSKQGHLLCCNHTFSNTFNSYDYHVCRTFEKFPIVKLCVIASELNDFIVCLADQCLTLHEASEPYKTIGLLVKCKPIFDFACRFIENDLYILISAKNRLILFKWLNNDVEEIISLNMIDTAQQVLWCDLNSLFIAMKQEYRYSVIHKQQGDSAFTTSIDQPTTIMTLGSHANENLPLMVSLADKSIVGLSRDCKIIDFFEMSSGHIAKDINSSKFSDNIIAIAFDSPYLLAILHSNIVEIRSVTPSMLIQKISFQKISLLSVGTRGCVYLANDTQAWKINGQIDLQENLNYLKNAKQFELALQLAEANKPLIDLELIVDIKKSIAATAFNQRKFTKCFDILTELNTDVLFLISLLPELLPEKYSSTTEHFKEDLRDYQIELISDNDRRNAIESLMQNLSIRRIEHARPIKLHYLDFKDHRDEHILSISQLKRHEALLELIDTVLLKCYLKVNPSLVTSLLRIKNCCCIISEAEKDLKTNKMFDELSILYKRKKMFRKYLELLQKEAKKSKKNSQSDIEKIATFLISLKNDQLPLILEFAPLVLSENLELGLQIFTEANNDSKNFNRDIILEFLKRECVQAVIPYLEQIIYKWNDERPLYHEELLLHYLERVRNLLKQYIKSLSVKQAYVTNKSSDNDEIQLVRRKLRTFLENDKYFTVKDALKLIGFDQDLMEERAILYGRLGEHMKALDIYINILMDFEAAERHCQMYYDKQNLKNAEIFFDLFHFYITGNTRVDNEQRSSQTENNFRNNEHGIKNQQNITEALKLLRRHATKINIVSAFALIPSNTPLTRICTALKAVFEALNNRLTTINLMLSLTTMAIKRTENNLNVLKRQRVHINQNVECFICSKRIMETAFVQHHNRSISHFYCYDKTKLERSKVAINSKNTIKRIYNE